MSRINTNVSSLVAGRVLGQQNADLTTSLERLSTGLAINRGSDNPAGLIASENLRSERASISAAIGNAERAGQVVNVAEGGLQEISNLLVELQGLTGESANIAGLSDEEREANQLQVDSILGAIDRIASSTSFSGTQLLNGTFDFNVTGQNVRVEELQVNAASLEFEGEQAVNLIVTASAQRGTLFLSTGGALDLAAANSSFVFELAGTGGSREFSFGSGTTQAQIVEAVNTFTSVTGVSAVQQATGVLLRSAEFGSNEFVEVNIVNEGGITGSGGIFGVSAIDTDVVRTTGGTAFAVGATTRDEGQDVAAVVNGQTASTDGLNVRLATPELDVEFTLTENGGTTATFTNAFTITGGGAQFNIGPSIDISNQVNLGIGNVSSRTLGSVGTGFLDELGSGRGSNLVDGDVGLAQDIINESINQVSSLRGRLGAFQANTLGSSINSLGVALENISAAESAIRDTDFAAETAALTRSQILVNAATNSLSIANNQPSAALSLLG